MKIIKFFFGLMLALMLVAPSLCNGIYTVPTAAPTPPTIPDLSTPGGPNVPVDPNNQGPPSVTTTEKPAPVVTDYPLYGIGPQV